MRLRLTLVTRSVIELAVTCPPGAAWGELVEEFIRAGLATRADRSSWYAGATPLDDTARIGVPPLLDGSVVSTRPAGDLLSSLREGPGHETPTAATAFDMDGHLLVNRGPRVVRSPPVVEIRLPPAPERREPARLPWMAMAVPLLLAGSMAAYLKSPSYLLFGLMSPAMMLGNVLTERGGGRRSERRRLADWQRETDGARSRISTAIAAEASQRRTALPDTAELFATVRDRLTRLWERRGADDDALVLRIGLARLPSRVVVEAPDPAEPAPMVDDVPLGLRLRDVGVLGLAGARAEVIGLAHWLAAQIAGWHSPREARLVVLADGDAALSDWVWASLLPHCRSDEPGTCHAYLGSLDRVEQVRRRVAELELLLAERAEHQRAVAPWSGSVVVVVLDGSRRLRAVPGVARLLEHGPSVGIYLICLDTTHAGLPVECRAYVELTWSGGHAPARALVTGPDGLLETVVPDRVGSRWVQRFAQALAPLRDATPDDGGADIPDRCRLLDLLGDKAIEPSMLAQTWSTRPSSTAAVIGVRADGPHTLDIRRDGPHVLIGGTTGAGKSELLQTLIASLAVASSPADLSFVLVDYKGGAAFADCAQLPHTLGLVTDLDPQLAERALTSLSAELKRREAILREAGARDLEGFVAQDRPGRPLLPRLVLLVDEFRMIAQELPDFLDGMVRIAALGRSLGVHLVLATQRPAGIVSADIAANVNLRIALRVRDQVDSEDVIEARDAAAISASTPGRALARVGSEPLVLFQTALVSGPNGAPADDRCSVEPLSLAALGDPPARVTLTTAVGGSTDLATIVTATRQAAHLLGVGPARRPWLPPLPDLVTLNQLDPGAGRWTAPYAAVDRPDQQAQQTLCWDVAQDAHLAVVGTMRSGRSTLLRTLAGSLAARLTPDDVHLHAIDGGAGALVALARLPHTGVVASSDQVPRGVRLLDKLTEEVGRRRAMLAKDGLGSIAEQRDSARAQDRLPYLVLLVDGWEAISNAWIGVEHGRPIDVLHQLLRDGPGVGLRVVVSGDRGLLMSQLGALVRDKVILRLAEPTDLAAAGIPASAAPHRMPPGRGLRAIDHAQIQAALLHADPSGAGQIAALDRIAGGARTATPGLEPIRIEPLPLRISTARLTRRLASPPAGWALVGAGGDAGDPVGLELAGSSAVVAGPPRSGRTTALQTMAGWLAAHGTDLVVIGPEPSSLTALVGSPGVVDVVAGGEPRRLQRLLDRKSDCCVVVDDVERLVDAESEDIVLQWFKGHRVTGSLLVAGNAADLAAMFRGLFVVARRSSQGLLLQPSSAADADLLGVRVTGSDVGERRPGRGLLVRDGVATPVQVALP